MTPRQVSSKVANKQTKKTTDKSNTKGKETNEIIKHLKKKLLPERRTKYTEEGKKKNTRFNTLHLNVHQHKHL
jgi:hypothetical protein